MQQPSSQPTRSHCCPVTARPDQDMPRPSGRNLQWLPSATSKRLLWHQVLSRRPQPMIHLLVPRSTYTSVLLTKLSATSHSSLPANPGVSTCGSPAASAPPPLSQNYLSQEFLPPTRPQLLEGRDLCLPFLPRVPSRGPGSRRPPCQGLLGWLRKETYDTYPALTHLSVDLDRQLGHSVNTRYLSTAT